MGEIAQPPTVLVVDDDASLRHGRTLPLNAMAKERDKDKAIPTGRIRRTAKVGGLLGGQTARNYATKAANLTRDEDGRRRAAEKRQLEAAEQIVEVLGQMKGAAMKIGQVASFIDLAGMPPEVRHPD